MKNFEIIEKYILGQLSAEKEKEVEERLQNDTDFRNEYEEIRELIIAVESKGLEESLQGKKIKDSSEKKGEVVSIDSKRKGLYQSLLIAASVVVIVLCGWWFYNSSTTTHKQLMSDAFYTDPGLPTKMSATDHYLFYDAMIDYKTQDYKTALKKWSRVSSGIGQDTITYYQAMAHLNLGEFPKAENLLKSISENSPLHEKAQWRTVEIYIRRNKYKQAQEYLEQLPSDIHSSYEEVKNFLKNQ